MLKKRKKRSLSYHIGYFIELFRLAREFFINMKTSPLPVKEAVFDLYSAHMAIEQWGFFSVPQLLENGTSV